MKARNFKAAGIQEFLARTTCHCGFEKLIWLLAILAAPAMATASPVLLGPGNPGAEDGPDAWWRGASGGGYLSIDNTDPASGNNDFTLGNTNLDGDNSADWRSVIFPLGQAAKGAQPMTFSFAYKLTDEVKAGDNMRVQFRFFDHATNFLGQKEFWLGSKSQDSAMNSYKTITVDGIHAPRRAEVADIRASINLYGDRWSSGTGRLDDFSVTTTKRSLLLEVVIPAVALLGITVAAALLLHFRRKRSQ
jgi:hypothetical protein